MVVIQSSHHNLVIGASSHDNKVTLQEYNGSSFQKWDIVGDTIKNRGNGQVLDVTGSGGSGTSVICYTHYGTPNQEWIFNHDGTIQSKLGGNLVLDIHSSNFRNGAELIVFSKHGGKNQLFSLVTK